MIMKKSCTKAMLECEGKINVKLASLASCMNLTTDQRVEASTKSLKHHTLHVHQMVGVMTP